MDEDVRGGEVMTTFAKFNTFEFHLMTKDERQRVNPVLLHVFFTPSGTRLLAKGCHDNR